MPESISLPDFYQPAEEIKPVLQDLLQLPMHTGETNLDPLFNTLSRLLPSCECQVYRLSEEDGEPRLHAASETNPTTLPPEILQQAFRMRQTGPLRPGLQTQTSWTLAPILRTDRENQAAVPEICRSPRSTLGACRWWENPTDNCRQCPACPMTGFLVVRHQIPLTEADMALLQLFAHQISHTVTDQLYPPVLQHGLVDSIISSLSSGLIILDQNMQIVKANPYTENLLGLDTDQLCGASLDQLFPGLNLSLDQRRGEYQLPLKSGESLTIGYNLSTINGAQEKVDGAVILFRDLTEIKQLRQQVQHKERFAIIGEMTSWVAHEVKNPLFGIRAIAEILVQEEQGKTKVFAESILQETGRLSHLVEDLLNYGKPIELNLQLTRPGTLIGEALAMVGCDPDQLQVDIEINDRELQGLFDRDRMVHVLLNILRNSVEAGADSIRIQVTRLPDRAIGIQLHDNGSGIPEQVRQKILRPFFTTKSSGTGLGLAICKKIVEQHGGRINIESPESGGTCVSLFFSQPLLENGAMT